MLVDVIYDSTSVANTALDTGVLDLGLTQGALEGYDALLIEVVPSGAVVGTPALDFLDPGADAALPVQSVAMTTDASAHTAGWGVGCGAASVGKYLGGIAAPVPRKVQFKLAALGAAITGHVRVLGQRSAH